MSSVLFVVKELRIRRRSDIEDLPPVIFVSHAAGRPRHALKKDSLQWKRKSSDTFFF
jgi:hypothetical protein